MEPHRWQCKRLDAIDLLPERNLINTFITTPKLHDVSSEYIDFKSHKSRSKKLLLYKYQPPPVRSKKVIKYEGPRLNQELPQPYQVSMLRSSVSPRQIQKQVSNEAEDLIEDMIRNRKQITLPSIEKPQMPYSNLKERFFKTKTALKLENDLKSETLLQKIKESIRSKSYRIESELSYWDKQPIRKWDGRTDRVTKQIRFKSPNKTIKTECMELENKQTSDIIGGLLETCGRDIMNWYV